MVEPALPSAAISLPVPFSQSHRSSTRLRKTSLAPVRVINQGLESALRSKVTMNDVRHAHYKTSVEIAVAPMKMVKGYPHELFINSKGARLRAIYTSTREEYT